MDEYDDALSKVLLLVEKLHTHEFENEEDKRNLKLNIEHLISILQGGIVHYLL